MIVLGVTGGIGSGKTTVCRLLELFGVPVFYADIEARNIVNANQEVITAIKKIFGASIYTGQILDRKALGDIVFNNNDLLIQLNNIVHPAVANHFSSWCDKNHYLPLVAKEAAILFETGAYLQVDKTMVVAAPIELRIKRVMDRDGLNRQQVLQRINAQWSDDKKIEIADFIVNCDNTQLVIPQLINIVKKIIP